MGLLGAAVVAAVTVALAVAAPSALAVYFTKIAGNNPLCSTNLWSNYTGEYCYVEYNDDGTTTGHYFSEDEFNSLTNQYVAAGDEATGVTVPTDIGTADASEGAAEWDGLANAVDTLKSGALNVLQGLGDWPAWSTLGEVSLGAGVFYLGWKVGSGIASLLGLDSGSGSAGSGTSTATANGAIMCGGGYLPQWGSTACQATLPACGVLTPCSPTGYSVGPGTYVATFSTAGGTVGSLWWATNGACGYTTSSLPPGFVPATVETGTTSSSGCGTPAPAGVVVSYWQGAKVTNLPGPGQGVGTPMPSTTSGTNTAPSETQQKSNAQGILTTPNNGDGAYNQYVCTVPGSPCYGQGSTSTETVTLPAITPNETYEQYVAAARAAGLLGTISQNVLTDTEADPSVQPNDVVRTNPQPGTVVDPNSAVQVFINPASVSASGAGGVSGTSQGPGVPNAPTLPGLTLPQAPTPCSVFPFGIPCWASNQLADLVSTTPQAPQFNVSTPAILGGSNLDVDLSDPFGFDLSGVMGIVRPILLFATAVVLMLWLGGFALGGSTGGGGDGGAGAEE